MASILFKISNLRSRYLVVLTSTPTMKVKWHFVKQGLKSLFILKSKFKKLKYLSLLEKRHRKGKNKLRLCSFYLLLCVLRTR